MCFQAMFAALVYLTAMCDGLTCGYSAILLPQLRANSSGFEADEEFESWIGKSRDLFLLTYTSNVNKGPTRCNSMQTFIHCHVTLHVSGE